jgi:hypothetical protein
VRVSLSQKPERQADADRSGKDEEARERVVKACNAEVQTTVEDAGHAMSLWQMPEVGDHRSARRIEIAMVISA